MHGDSDIAATAALMGDPARARVLLTLADGREPPASVLAAEAGVSASTTSAHLAKLLEGGLVAAERHGRHRYFRLSGPDVARAIESLAQLSPATPVRSLREGTRAHAIRAGRTCYDHLAGRAGVALMGALIDREILSGGDGRHRREHARVDRPSAVGRDVDYRLTPSGADALRELGVPVDAAILGGRPLIRYCIDWSEQEHHLSGALGAAVTRRLFDLHWLRRFPRSRAVTITAEGRVGLREHLGLSLPS